MSPGTSATTRITKAKRDSHALRHYITPTKKQPNIATVDGVTVKNQIYLVIVPFIPVSSPIDNANWLHALEIENDLPKGSVNLARWIKPKEKRTPQQRVVHLMLQLNDPHPANKIIKEGLYTDHAKLQTHAEQPPPPQQTPIPHHWNSGPNRHQRTLLSSIILKSDTVMAPTWELTTHPDLLHQHTAKSPPRPATPSNEPKQQHYIQWPIVVAIPIVIIITANTITTVFTPIPHP
ncbi:hypothetical protein PAXINDRAFT_16733 [Paxillus involutus ATCC 200175]|uniref:Uncharacterized protein n=1 Tax=Paxillus involutus ATCC 200175 TaxID=664439 RepID=A0A0C9TSS3_PAXIN|nr:hypothetical protein PAXINDRAFT_16733 [Paxillus involutus ATCC 200175]